MVVIFAMRDTLSVRFLNDLDYFLRILSLKAIMTISVAQADTYSIVLFPERKFWVHRMMLKSDSPAGFNAKIQTHGVKASHSYFI